MPNDKKTKADTDLLVDTNENDEHEQEVDDDPFWDAAEDDNPELDKDKEISDFVKRARQQTDAGLAAIFGGVGLANLFESVEKSSTPEGADKTVEKVESKNPLSETEKLLKQLDAQFNEKTTAIGKQLEKLSATELRHENAKPLVERQWQKNVVELLEQLPDRWDKMPEHTGPINLNTLREKLQKGHLNELTKSELLIAVKMEALENKFGSASEIAYKRSISWFNDHALSVTKESCASGLTVRPGGPIPSFTSEKDQQTDFGAPLEGYKAKILSPNFKVDSLKEMTDKGQIKTLLNFDFSSKPSGDELIKFENSKDWIDTEKNRLAENKNQIEANRRYQVIHDFLNIKDAGWAPPENSGQLAAYCQRADDVCNLMLKVRNYAEAIKSLEGIDGDFKSRALNPEIFPGKLDWNEKTKGLEKISLNLPNSLACTPENERKFQELQKWLDTYGPRVDQVLGDMKKGVPLRYGDFVEKGFIRKSADGDTVEVLDQQRNALMAKVDGKIISRHLDGQMRNFATGDKVEKTPEYSSEDNFDYVGDKFSCRKDEKNGEIIVAVDRCYEKDHFLNYNRWLGTQVGEITDERRYRPDQLVTVQNGSGLPQLVRADRLAEFQSMQALWHHGGKIATCAMDVGMVASGGVGARAAFQAGRALYVTTNVARVALGLGGLLDPTFRQMGELGESLQKARHNAILFDVTQGLLRKSPALLGSGKMLFESSSMVEIQKVIEASKTLSRLHGATTKIFAMCDAVYLPSIGGDIAQKARLNLGYNPHQLVEDAQSQIGTSQIKNKNIEIQTPPAATEATKEMLKVYEKILDVKDPTNHENLKKRFDSIQAQLGQNSATDFLKKDLAGYFLQNGTQLQALKKANSDSVPAFLIGKEKHGTEEERVAVAVGLLHLSSSSGAMPAEGVLIRREVDIPSYIKITSGHDGERIEKTIPSEKITQVVTVKDVVSELRDQALNAANPQTKIVAADALYRVGAIGSGRYAATILEQLEKNTSASQNSEIRLGMLMQLSNLIDASKISEIIPPTDSNSRRISEAERYGASSAELTKRLKMLVATESNPEFRAMTTAILHAHNFSDSDVRVQNYAKDFELCQKEKKSFRDFFVSELKRNLTTPIPIGAKIERDAALEERLQAVKALRYLKGSSHEANVIANEQLNEAMDESLKTMGLRGIKNKTLTDRSNLALTMRVIDTMMAEKPTLTIKQRQNIAATASGIMDISHPENIAERKEPALAKLAVVARMREIYEDSEPNNKEVTEALKSHKGGMVSALKETIRPEDESGIQSGWGQYPEMRIAAIAGLKNLGSVDKETVDLVANFLNYDTKKFGTSAFKEQNPGVRAAAVEAIQSLAEHRFRFSAAEIAKLKEKKPQICEELGIDPNLHVDELIKRERDPIALDTLWRSYSRKQRLDPQSAEYEKQFSMASESLDSARLTTITNDQILAFVKSRAPILDATTFDNEVKRSAEQRRVDPYEGFFGWCETFITSRETSKKDHENATNAALYSARRDKEQERKDALTALTKMDNLSVTEQEMSIKTLLHLIRVPDTPLFKDGNTETARVRASELMLRLCDSEANRDIVGNKELLSRAVVSSLLDSAIDTNPQVKFNLLKCVDALTVRDAAKFMKDGREPWLLSRERAGLIYLDVLKREKQAFLEQTPEERKEHQATKALQMKCLQKLYDLRANFAENELDVRAHNTNFRTNLPDVSHASKQVLEGLRYGIEHLQKDALVDKVSSLSSRADFMKAALYDSKFNYEGACTAIFRSCKDKPIEKTRIESGLDNEYGDPRVAVLLDALKHENERVQISAAIVLADSKADSHFIKACSALSNLAVFGSKERYRSDAAAILRDIIQRGQPVEQDIAFNAWNKSYIARKSAAPSTDLQEPLKIPHPEQLGVRKVPIALLHKQIATGKEQPTVQQSEKSQEEKRLEILRSQNALEKLKNDAKDAELLTKKPVFLRSMSTIACHQKSQDYKPDLTSSEISKFFQGGSNKPNILDLIDRKAPEFVKDSIVAGKLEVGRPIWGLTRHAENDHLQDQEKLKLNESLAGTLLESRLQLAQSPEEKIEALKISCNRTPISSVDDKRLHRLIRQLDEPNYSVRKEAAAIILNSSGEGFIHKGFSDECRRRAKEIAHSPP